MRPPIDNPGLAPNDGAIDGTLYVGGKSDEAPSSADGSLHRVAVLVLTLAAQPAFAATKNGTTTCSA
jgi:hypothetical protein